MVLNAIDITTQFGRIYFSVSNQTGIHNLKSGDSVVICGNVKIQSENSLIPVDTKDILLSL